MIEKIQTISNIEPRCSVFGECGGCQYQSIPYSEELQKKETALRDMLEQTLGIDRGIFEPVVASPREYHYRSRIDLRLVKAKSGEIFIGFTPENSTRVLPIDACPIALPAISESIPAITRQVKETLLPRYRNANLVIRAGDEGKARWGGIGRRSLNLNESDYLWTEVHGKKIFYSMDTFFQANLSILPLVMERISALPIFTGSTVFLDLYGGVGLFGICLANQVQKVLLIEENVHSLKVAQYNAKHHQFPAFDIIEGRVEDQLPACLAAVKGDNKVAMIDPPRAGLSPEAAKILVEAKELNHLLYLSCHPEALIRDLQCFQEKGWHIQKIMPFDFFPRTRHIETLVHLTPNV